MREANVIRRAKARAKDMSRDGSMTHQQALDAIAREAGHRHWTEMAASRGRTAGAKCADPVKDVGPDDGHDPFAPAWLDAARRAGETEEEHLLGVGALFAGRASDRRVAEVIALCAASLLSRGGPSALSSPSVAAELEDLRHEATQAAAERRREAVASKAWSSARPWSELVGILASRHGGLAERVGRSLSASPDDDAWSVVEEARSAMSRDLGRAEVGSGVGVAAWILSLGVRRPLRSDERELMLSSLTQASPSDRTEVVLRGLSDASVGVDAACRAMSPVLGMPARKAAWLLRPDLGVFGEAAGSMGDELDAVGGGLSVLEGSRSPFARWILDAVAKARSGRRAFRFDPLREALSGTGEADTAALDALAREVAALASEDGRTDGRVSAAFASLVALCAKGFSNLTILDLSPSADPSGVSMSTVLSVFDDSAASGPRQTGLYASLNGLDARWMEGLSALFDPEVRRSLDRALAPFRHPAIAAACGVTSLRGRLRT